MTNDALVSVLENRIQTAKETQARYVAYQRARIKHSVFDPVSGKSKTVLRKFFCWEFITQDPLAVVLESERRLALLTAV